MREIDRFSSETYINSRLQFSIEKKTIDSICRIHWHEFYEIEFIIDGSGSYFINGAEYAIKPGMAFFMTTTDVHSVECDGDVTLVNIMFSSEWLDEEIIFSILSVKQNVAVQLHGHESERFNVLCEMLLDKYSSENAMKQKYIKNLLECAVIDILRDTDKHVEKKVRCDALSAPVKKALIYIQENFREQVTLESTAKCAGLSATYFSQVFKEYCSMSYKEYLLQLRFEHAKKLLAHTSLPVIEICYACGFCTLSHFMRSFKSRYDSTPGLYRDEHR